MLANSKPYDKVFGELCKFLGEHQLEMHQDKNGKITVCPRTRRRKPMKPTDSKENNHG